MPDIKRILVPVNGTEESTKALKLADTLAQIYNAEIALLLVTYFNENTDDKANEDSWLATPFTGSVAQYSHNVLDNARRYLSAKLQISTHNLSGQPKFKILEFAQIYSADIIIMGCRNLSFFDSILKGSVSRYILEKSTCPVIIVK
ncbi:universal stress protein [Megamonas hypermegale]|uniref:universal stress protein n=1 Tax=Megamonas hypermegale TaxID=158847 RepID=UPI00195703FF|nr:universal stress protein [Megamonas hypermegale]MBM6833946.1 universal stress protein [Megamonas hypermegale]